MAVLLLGPGSAQAHVPAGNLFGVWGWSSYDLPTMDGDIGSRRRWSLSLMDPPERGGQQTRRPGAFALARPMLASVDMRVITPLTPFIEFSRRMEMSAPPPRASTSMIERATQLAHTTGYQECGQ